MRQTTTAEVRLDEGKATSFGACEASDPPIWLSTRRLRSNFVAPHLDEAKILPNSPEIRGMSA